MLIDTSGFFALHSEKDQHHVAANRWFEQARLRVTTSYILAEYVALALIRGLPRSEVLAFSEEALFDDTLEIVWVNRRQHIQAVELLRQRPDKTYSLCNAVSFILMRERRINNALTTDKHFV